MTSHDLAGPFARTTKCGRPADQDEDGGTVTCPDCLAIREKHRGHPNPRADQRVRGDLPTRRTE